MGKQDFFVAVALHICLCLSTLSNALQMQTQRSWTAGPGAVCPGCSLAWGYRKWELKFLLKIAGCVTLSKSPCLSQ